MNRTQAARSLTAKLFTANFRTRLIKPALAAAAFLAAALLGGNAQAQYDNWQGPDGGSGNFSNNANWSTGAPPTTGQQVTFLGGSNFSLTNDLTGTNEPTIGGLFLNSPTVVNISGADFFLNGAGGNPIQINSSGTLTINNNVSLTDPTEAFISTSGASGSIVLNGNITTTSNTVVNAGTGGGNNLNISFNNNTVTLGGLNYLGNSGVSAAYSTNPSAVINNSNFTVNGSITDQRGNLIFEGTTTANITGSINNSTGDWGNVVIQDTANVTAGSINMAATTNTGQVVLNGGTLTVGSINAIDWEIPGNLMSLLVFNGSQVDSSASSATYVQVTPSVIGIGSRTNTAYIGTGGLLLNTEGFNDTIGTQLVDLTTTQTASDSALTSGMAGPGALTKSGAGTLTLSNGANSFSGGVNVTGGTLATTAAGALGSTTNTLSVSGGGVIDLETTTQTVGATSLGSSTIQSTGGAGTLNTGVVTVSGASSVSSGATVSTGTNAVNINSGGALTLNASTLSTTGTVTVNSGGSLIFGASSAISSGATIQGAGGTITMANTTQTVGALTLAASSGTTILDLTGGGILTASDANGALSPGGTTLLDINDWYGTAGVGGNAGYNISLGTLLTMSDLNDIEWTNVNGVAGTSMGAQIVGTQLTPLSMSPVPEPSTVFGALCLLGLVGWRNRRQIGGALQGLRLLSAGA